MGIRACPHTKGLRRVLLSGGKPPLSLLQSSLSQQGVATGRHYTGLECRETMYSNGRLRHSASFFAMRQRLNVTSTQQTAHQTSHPHNIRHTRVIYIMNNVSLWVIQHLDRSVFFNRTLKHVDTKISIWAHTLLRICLLKKYPVFFYYCLSLKFID